jgi:xanthine dehydrogenase accessory factor
MRETERILRLWADCERTREEAVLATVVRTQGSSYRLPGARLLLTRSGLRAGSVSGGCLEDDLVKRAWWFTENGPMIRRYDTTPDGDIAPEYGLGCNGIIHVLLERIQPGAALVLNLLREARAHRKPATVAHSIRPADSAGLHLTVDTAGHREHNVGSPAILDLLSKALDEGIARSDEVFIETLVPATRLLIFGAGDDAISMAGLAKHFGWEVCIYDGRSHYARPERFPFADSVTVRTAGMASALGFDPWTAAVVMSHSYSQDLQVFQELAPHPLTYLGLLGPRKRTEQMLSEAGLEDRVIKAQLFSPMGLDLGAEGSEQVALAVVAEIQAVMNGREGGLLRQKQGPIHSEGTRSQTSDTGFKSIVCA